LQAILPDHRWAAPYGRTGRRKSGLSYNTGEYTRRGSIDMERSGVEAYAATGVDRLVVGTPSTCAAGAATCGLIVW
jgi:hypothetical protein